MSVPMDFQRGSLKIQCRPLRVSKEFPYPLGRKLETNVSSPKGSHRDLQAEEAKPCT